MARCRVEIGFVVAALALPIWASPAVGQDWTGVWVANGVPCPTAEQIEASANGVLLQGPHWHILNGLAYDAVRATPIGKTGASDVTGLCRSFGRLETRTWRFEQIEAGQAEVAGLSEDPVTLSHCPGT